MSEKIYQIDEECFDTIIGAAGCIVACLAKIKAEELLTDCKGDMERGKARKPAPHTHVCKCKNGKPVVETVCKTKCRKAVRKPAIPSVPLMEIAKKLEREEEQKKKFCGSADIAKELGRRTSTISHYATANNIGKIKGTVRVFNIDEADRIRRHFNGGK